jgi:hypothetical protein
VKQGFVEHFQNLNLEHARVKNHGYIELEDLYHDRVKIPHRLRKKNWKNNRMEIRP